MPDSLTENKMEEAVAEAAAAERAAIRAELSPERHHLQRTSDDGVGCLCGEYTGADHGASADRGWRAHLIAVAVDAREP